MSDLIDRQAAIGALAVYIHNVDKVYSTGLMSDADCRYAAESVLGVEELPSAQPEQHHDEWCTDCKEYDQTKHCCPRFNRVIREALGGASRWVSVEAGLPENMQKCLLTTLLNGMKYVYVGTYATDLYSVNKHDFADRKGTSGWYYRDSEYGYIEYNNVVAWMPLPDPYEPEEQDANK